MRRSLKRSDFMCYRYVPIYSKVQHPPPGIWTFEDWLVQIPSPWGKKAVQMPHQLLLKYLSSKTNFVFNQTLYTLFREICSNDTFERLLKTLLKELFTNKGGILSCKSVKPCKNRKNSRVCYVRTRDKSGSNSPPFKRNVQIPPSMHSQMPGVCPGGGGGCWSFELIGALCKFDALLIRLHSLFCTNSFKVVIDWVSTWVSFTIILILIEGILSTGKKFDLFSRNLFEAAVYSMQIKFTVN